MSPGERSYMAGVAVADRLLANGLPLLGVVGSLDGQEFTLNADVGGEITGFAFPLATNIMTCDGVIRRALKARAA